MEDNEVRPGSLRSWLLAARPKTLTSAATPVMISMAMAYSDMNAAGVGEHFSVVVAVLCFLFAFIMQIDANFINDYFDFMKGTDRETRLGPKRACAQGWVSVSAMRKAIAVTTLLACAVGLPLVYFGGFEMILVGLVCVLFCFLYTTSLSYMGLGDLLVIVFFGIVPVCVPYYIQWAMGSAGLTDFSFLEIAPRISWTPVLLAALACGLAIDALLIVNNYRDRDTDREAGKRTIVVKIGARRAEILYLTVGLVAFHLCIILAFMGYMSTVSIPLLSLYVILHCRTYRKLVAINHGRELNVCLGDTARNILIFGITLTLSVLIWGA